jgi:glutamate-1-semialdehyde aminotransferase
VVIERNDLAWSVCQLGTRVWCCYSRQLPRNAADVRKHDILALRDLQRVYLANRGIWDFGTWAGPIVGVPASERDIDAYLAAWSGLVAEVCN